LFIDARTDASSSTIEITGVGNDETGAEPPDMDLSVLASGRVGYRIEANVALTTTGTDISVAGNMGLVVPVSFVRTLVPWQTVTPTDDITLICST